MCILCYFIIRAYLCIISYKKPSCKCNYSRMSLRIWGIVLFVSLRHKLNFITSLRTRSQLRCTTKRHFIWSHYFLRQWNLMQSLSLFYTLVRNRSKNLEWYHSLCDTQYNYIIKDFRIIDNFQCRKKASASCYE